MKLVNMALIGLFVAGASGLAMASSIEERIKPVGDTCMAGEKCASAVAAPVAEGAAGRAAEDIYKKCTVCHATGAAGAPKLGDAAAWAPRVEQGMATLYDHAIKGFNGMPAKGLCFDCTDEELKAAVDYMVDESK